MSENEEFVNSLKSDKIDFSIPSSKIIAPHLMERTSIRNWWAPMLDWYWNVLVDSQAYIAERIQGWSNAITEIEKAVEANNLKVAFAKLKQITKMDSGQKLVKTLRIGDSILVDQSDIDKAAAQYYKEIYKAD